jgi:uncharacterized protein with HEPN domain
VQDPGVRLVDIIETIDAVADIAKGLDFESYSMDFKTRRAVERCGEVISEATRHLSPEWKSDFPHIPWREIAAIGNLLRHEYYWVDDLLMWKVATQSLPELRPVIFELQSRLPPSDSEPT